MERLPHDERLPSVPAEHEAEDILDDDDIDLDEDDLDLDDDDDVVESVTEEEAERADGA